VASAQRWANGNDAGCAYWEQAEWYRTLRMGPDPAKELELLKKGLAAKDDGYGREIRARLGELVLTGTAVNGTATERVQWIGEAARQRLGTAEWMIGSTYTQHPEETESPTTSVEWIRRAARYGIPRALVMVGQAVMTREVSDLPYIEGVALEELAMRQNPLGVPGKESLERQLQLEQREELADSVALWLRVADQSGAFYSRADALRMPDTPDFAALQKAAEDSPDAALRLAYAYESKGDLAKAEGVYRTVWQDGAGQLWGGLALSAAKNGKWAWARQLYESAAGAGSHSACAEIARIEADGLAGSKDLVSAAVWWELAGKPAKSALTEEQKETVAARVADWKEKHPGW